MRVHKILTEAPVPFKLPQYMMNDPSSIDLKGMAAKAKSDADKRAAEEEQARIFAANKEKYSDLITRAQEAGSPDDMLDTLFKELVPNSGKADTVAGELVRAMMRILYRDYNDGDVFYEGYGIETCGSSVAYLIYMIEDLYDSFDRIANRRETDDDYTDSLNGICNQVLNYIFTNDSVWMPNEDDSRSRELEKVYEEDYRKDWEPEYDYDFQIPPTIQEYIDAGHIITDEFIERVKSALDNNWSTKYDDVEDSWSNYVNITGLKREGYDEVESWRMWDDSFWSDYIDELVDEYGDLDEDEDDEDDDEDDFDESLSKGKKNLNEVSNAADFNIGDRVLYQGKETVIRDRQDDRDYGPDYLIDNPDYSEERYPGKDSWKYRKIWVGSDIQPLKEVKLVENTDEQVIIGFSADGTRSYYNESDSTWRNSVAEATIYPNTDAARSVWFTLDKKPFKRVFVVCNTPGI